MRKKRYIYSMLTSLLSQAISVFCGIVLPRVLIGQYGSELYGASTSISQFLGYIAILEGGIGGVARAALYKPLAENDKERISEIVIYIQRFFRIIAIIFCFYTLFIACIYKYIARGNSFEWSFTFILVIVIALSSLAQYYFGISYTVLLQADQRQYITTILSSSTMLINTFIACFLAYNGVGMIGLKLAWCGVHFVRIGMLNIYISKKYNLRKIKVKGNYLPEKWDGLGQHIARNEMRKLDEFFDYIEFVINSAISVGFSVAFVLILPFVAIYTSGIKDACYYRPILAAIILSTQCIYLMRVPYHQLTIAAGHFKKTRNAAFIESGLNIFLSFIFSIVWGVEGVILATFISILYREIYYVFYLKSEIIYRNISKFVKRLCVTVFNLLINVFVFELIYSQIGEISTFTKWFTVAVFFVLIGTAITFVISFVFYKTNLVKMIKKLRKI